MPKIKQKDNIISLYCDDEVNIDDPSVPFILRFKQVKRQIETSKDLPLEIPVRLTNPDKLIQSTREYLKNKRQRDANWDMSDNNDVLDISVSKGSTDRALLLMDYFIKLIRVRGHNIKIEYGRTHVLMYTTEKEISLREKYDTITLDEYPYKKRISTGNLIFRVKPSYHKTWHDSKSVPLGEKIVSILAWLETSARELKAHWERNARRRKEEEE